MQSPPREAGVSRSVLTQRFRETVGRSPIQYLTAWRLQRAARMLRQDGRTVAEAAHAAVYLSEAAVSRTFKKLAGAAPSDWRRQCR